VTTFGDQVFQFGGEPVGGARFSSPWATPWFVDGVNGSDGTGRGKRPDRSLASIQAAVTAAKRGDVMYIRPKTYVVGTGFDRYVEDVTVPLATHDLSIIGVVNTLNPEFGVRWKHLTAQCLDNWAPALHVENIGFFAEDATYCVLLSDLAAGTKLGANGSTFYKCVFKGANFQVLSGGTGVTIERCKFTPHSSGVVAQLNISCSAKLGRQFVVKWCDFLDAIGAVASGPYIAIAPPCTEVLIDHCTFGQLPTGGCYISAAGANYGQLSNCNFGVADMTKATGLVLGSIIATACYDGKVALID